MSPFNRGIIITCLIGLLAGAIAKLLTPGRDPGGCIITMLIGIAGAWLATGIGRALGWYGVGDYPGFIGAVLGSILLLIVYRMFASKA